MGDADVTVETRNNRNSKKRTCDTGSTISGGNANYTGGRYAAIGGGYYNSTLAEYSAIPGGRYNQIRNFSDPVNFSMAFGDSVLIENSCRVVFFNSHRHGRFGVNRDSHDGGLSHPIHVGTDAANGNGARLTSGGVWTNASSKEKKENFQPVDAYGLLEKVSIMPIESWNYKDSDERHIGPVAEDFVAAFDVGTIRKEDNLRDNHYLAASDMAGVALIGVQELYRMVRDLNEKTERIENLELQMAELEALVEIIWSQQSDDNSGAKELTRNK